MSPLRPTRGPFNYRAFVRSPDGSMQTFEVYERDTPLPGQVLSSCCGTQTTAINDAGWVLGTYLTGGKANGFLRDPGGGVVKFKVPNMRQIVPGAINASNGVWRGFIRRP